MTKKALDKRELARRFARLGAAEQKKFLQLLSAKKIDFAMLPIVSAELPASAGDTAKENQPISLAPVSFAQQRMWFLHQLQPDSSHQNMSSRLCLTGPLDIERLQRCIDYLVQRHASLRTGFVSAADGLGAETNNRHGKPSLQPMQRIAAQANVPVQRLSVADLSGPEAEQALQQHAEQAFDLRRGPLFRVLLLESDQPPATASLRQYTLQLVLHHIVSDAHSMSVMISEFSALYASFSQGQQAALAPLPIAYHDYAVWQRRWLEAGERQRQLDYWREQLGPSGDSLMNLPYDFPRPTQPSHRAGQVAFALSPTLSLGIGQLASQQRCSVFTVLLAALNRLLHTYTGQDDLRIGVPVANRNRAEIQNLIGLFVNTLVLRNQVDSRLSFKQLLSHVNDTTLAAQSHQDLPFDQLVEALQPQRSLGVTPLFQVMYNHLSSHFDGHLQIADLRVAGVAQELDSVTFDLVLDTREGDDGCLRGVFTYATDLFRASTIESLSEHLQQLLTQVIAAPDEPLCQLNWLIDAEQQQLRRWNPQSQVTAAQPYLHQLIDRQAQLRADADALVFAKKRISYAELQRRSNQLAHELVARGVGPDQRVGVCLERGEQVFIAMIAVLKAGGAFVPLDPDYPAERLSYMANDSGLKWLISDPACLPTLQLERDVDVLSLPQLQADGLFERPVDAAPSVALHPQHLAYLIYTSGSTGQPKGVAINHAGLTMHTLTIGQRYGQSEHDVELHFASISFDGAVERWAVPLSHGSTLVVRPQMLWTAEETCHAIIGEGVTIAIFPPSYVGQLLDYIEQQIAADTPLAPALRQLPVRSYTLGGEAFTRETLERMQKVLKAPRILNGYGPTETVVTPLLWAADSQTRIDSPYAPIGSPVGERRAYILDAQLSPVPVGVSGELYLGGELGLARGYFERPGLSAERFLPDPFAAAHGGAGGRMYRSGDLARWLPDGSIEYLGRADQQVKVRGFRIELGEIESRLLAHAGVSEAAVALHTIKQRPHLIGYLVLDDSINKTDTDHHLQQIRAQLAEQLPDYMVPSRLLALADMPLTPAGKVDRRALPEPTDVAHGESEPEAPQTLAEQQLAQIWSQVLGTDVVDRQANFFELGGDSILSLQVVGQARPLGLQLTPKSVFQHQTLAQLASAASQTSHQRDIDQGPVQGGQTLQPIQQYFFAIDAWPNRNHFNQSVWLQCQRPLELDTLQACLLQLVQHHDALRLRFVADKDQCDSDNKGTYRAQYSSSDQIDAAELLWRREVASEAECEALCHTAQRSLDIHRGPMLRALYITSPGQADRLLLVIHHLVVDGVSWRLLLNDLQSLYQQRLSGSKTPMLAAKTDSLQHWGQQLHQWARGDQAEVVTQQWLKQLQPDAPVLALPTTNKVLPSRRQQASCQRQLEREATQQLLRQSNHNNNNNNNNNNSNNGTTSLINSLLLTALARAVRLWSIEQSADGSEQAEVLPIYLEGHGRENLLDDDNTDNTDKLDVSRTVGWFTSLFPVALPLIDDVEQHLQQVQQRLQQVPHNGVSYGVLRYLASDQIRQQLALIDTPQVVFNYLGQFQVGNDNTGLLQPLTSGGGQQQDPDAPMAAALSLTGQVYDGQMTLSWTYSGEQFTSEQVEQLADHYQQQLQTLLELNTEANETKPTALTFSVPAPGQGLQQAPAVALQSLNRPTSPADAQLPLFCVHPVTGRSTGYLALASQLQTQRPVLSIDCRSFAEPNWADRSIAEMADDYLAAIRQQQPSGPYHLLGWSMGASLVMEIAQRLQQADESVAFVGLIDPFVPCNYSDDYFQRQQHGANDPGDRNHAAPLIEQLQQLLPQLDADALADCWRQCWNGRDWQLGPDITHLRHWLAQQSEVSQMLPMLDDLLFSWTVDLHMRRLSLAYRLPNIDCHCHIWWAKQRPSGSSETLAMQQCDFVQQSQCPAPSERIIDADHYQIVKDPQVLREVAKWLKS